MPEQKLQDSLSEEQDKPNLQFEEELTPEQIRKQVEEASLGGDEQPDGTVDDGNSGEATPEGLGTHEQPEGNKVDYEKQYRELQKDHTRKAQRLAELERQMQETGKQNEFDPEEDLTQFAQDPRGYLRKQLDEAMKPIKAEIFRARYPDMEEYRDDMERVMNEMPELSEVANRDVTLAGSIAYRLAKERAMANKKAAEVQKKAVEKGNAYVEGSRSVPQKPKKKELTHEEIMNMPREQFEKYYDALTEED